MNCTCGIIMVYGKEDILTDCKYCRNDQNKRKENDRYDGYAYGKECVLKFRKRKMNRCRTCYFGANRYGH